MSPVFAVQAAIQDALAAASAVTALLGDPPRIWDRPPRDAIFPFASYGAARSETLPDGLQAHRLTLIVYSRAGGREEAAETVAAIRSALHDAPLPLGEGALANLRVVYADVLKSDGRTFQGLVRLRAVTES